MFSVQSYRLMYIILLKEAHVNKGQIMGYYFNLQNNHQDVVLVAYLNLSDKCV